MAVDAETDMAMVMKGLSDDGDERQSCQLHKVEISKGRRVYE